jgi:hypothetical protein
VGIVGISPEVINPLSFVNCDVFVGKEDAVINPLSFVRSLVFVGIAVVLGNAPTSEAVKTTAPV